MGILKKIAKIFLIFIGFIFVLDVYLQLSSQHRIPGTKCYLEDLHGLDIARLVYKPFPLWTKSKELVEYSIDEAMDELGDDYTEDEIRLVRIKFISEMAN